ncbi:uncharacterized protein LOC18439908 [Amborella trichopoda]|nr:uncharacterized protein LOC18439908 [Amborella trichopoda]|eukprot:XP_006850126.2 uncharacterized protein LOC18439908 [Amborella trichopoda]
MIVSIPILEFAKHTACLGGGARKHLFGDVWTKMAISHYYLSSLRFSSRLNHERHIHMLISRAYSRATTGPQLTTRLSFHNSLGSDFIGQGRSLHPQMRFIFANSTRPKYLGFSTICHNVNLKLSVTSHLSQSVSKISFLVKPRTRSRGGISALMAFGACVCCAHPEQVKAESPVFENDHDSECDPSSVKSVHGKNVYTDYSVTGIPGDGRCMFRSVAHGACLRSGKPPPNESVQREMADELRARVADQFVKRRSDTEWFIEGDFDTYVSQIRKPHVWGGEPELLMASHVLQMPITVYMHDDNYGGLIAIAEYGQEYGKDDPICVLYHGYGHYEALQFGSL